jgi:hypothetical protein
MQCANRFFKVLPISFFLLIFSNFRDARADWLFPGFRISDSGIVTLRGLDDLLVFYLGAGVIGHNAGFAATNRVTGTKPFLGNLYTQVSAMAIFRLDGSWALSPDFHYAPLAQNSPDGKESTNVFSFGVRIFYKIFKSVDLHLGPSVLFYQISGVGGLVSLNNGLSTTSFAAPNGSSVSRLICLDTGLGLSFGAFRLDTSILVSGFFSNSKRSISPLVTLSVGVF